MDDLDVSNAYQRAPSSHRIKVGLFVSRAAHVIVWSFVLASALSISGCATPKPYHTEVNGKPTLCPPNAKSEVQTTCHHVAWERKEDSYDLFYAEFDDQGLLHPADEPESGNANQQIDGQEVGINRALRTEFRSDHLNIIVYVHGWKHNANTGDSDVKEFRHLLQDVSNLERAQPDPHKVVGIFVGWRGLSASVEPFKELSFWDRKNTSFRVAIGSARELFSRLRAYQQSRNEEWDALTRGPATLSIPIPADLTRRAPVQMLIIGHSFGAQLVYGAIAESLMEALGSAPTDPGARIRRYGDMVILLNPAFEATRFLPLYRMAAARAYDHYQAPLLVSITSTADHATGTLFPLGRAISTVFEHYSDAEERKANLQTIGHNNQIITHELKWAPAASAKSCPGWRGLAAEETSPEVLQRDLQIEKNAAADFFLPYQNGKPGGPIIMPTGQWVRTFCGNTQLSFVGAADRIDANVPIWNVRTYSPIIKDHNDIEEPALEAFLRQLYTDVTFYPSLYEMKLNQLPVPH